MNGRVGLILNEWSQGQATIEKALRFAKAEGKELVPIFLDIQEEKVSMPNLNLIIREQIIFAKELGLKVIKVPGNTRAECLNELFTAYHLEMIYLPYIFTPWMKGQKDRNRKNEKELSEIAKIYSVTVKKIHINPLTLYETEKINGFSLLTLSNTLYFIGIIFLCTFGGYLFGLFGFDNTNIMILYILGVLMISNQLESPIYGGVAAIVSVFVFNFCFTEPRFTFQAIESQYPINFITMVAASLITSFITRMIKRQAKLYKVMAYFTEVLFTTNKALQKAKDVDDILEISAKELKTLLKASISFYQPMGDEMVLRGAFPFSKGEEESYQSKKEMAVARWASDHQKMAGHSTMVLTGVQGLYIPIPVEESTAFVMGIYHVQDTQMKLLNNNLLWGIVNEISVALEKQKLNEETQKTKMLAEKEHFRANLLRSISHDLRTPLTGISGNASILLKQHGASPSNGAKLSDDEETALIKGIYDDSLWLVDMVENLLSITKLENSDISLNKNIELMDDLVAEAVSRVADDAGRIIVHPLDDLLMVYVEGRLIVQVLVNLLNNALKYTPKDTKIEVSMKQVGPMADVEVADRGPGLTLEDREKIFNMYYRAGDVPGDKKRGLGLGLALCQSIIKVHEGQIYVKSREGGGSIFGFRLKTQDPNWREEDE